ncbi:MAG: homoserine dehydrogenase [Armatimonadota bacterium]|nr:homoserine dehydrogenase [bacterium]
MKDIINVGVIGFGIVGVGAVKILVDNQESIDRKVGSKLRVKRIADLDITTPRPVDIDKSVLTTDANEIINDPEIDIVVETIGGVRPAKDFIIRSLDNGKHVATANKELIAKHGSDILPKAAELGLDFMFEASVGGGIPIIRPLKACLAGNEILEIKGIVNGTTNFILTKMRQEGLDFADVLKDAQAKGYAEADPTADVEGYDAAYKISILASIAFTSRMDASKVYHEGITNISADDMKYADELGYVIKLLAIAKRADDGMLARVHPAFVPKSHPLANVNGVMNGIWVKGSAVGEVMFSGPGAGSLAAGSAVVGDVIDIARNINFGSTSRIQCTCYDNREMLGMESVACKNYVRIVAEDRPRVLATIATEFADHDVSIESVIQKVRDDGKAEIVWLTHEAAEVDMRNALDAIRALPVVTGIGNRIRVEE